MKKPRRGASRGAPESGFEEPASFTCGIAKLPNLQTDYFAARVKSALDSPRTVNGLDWSLAPSCHVVSV